MDNDARRLQALRLVTAYLKIQDGSIRETIVELAEAAANGATFQLRYQSGEEDPPKTVN